MITEDGTGVANAISYISTDDLDAYCLARNIDTVADLLPAQKSGLVVQSTDYLEQTYRARAPQLTSTQGLQFPSRDPRAFALIRRAAFMLALEAAAQPLTQRVEQTVKRQEDKLGSLLSITEYDGAAPLDHYPQITAMLRDVSTIRTSGITSGRVTRDPLTDPLPPLDASQGAYNPIYDVSGGFGLNGWGVFTGWDRNL